MMGWRSDSTGATSAAANKGHPVPAKLDDATATDKLSGVTVPVLGAVGLGSVAAAAAVSGWTHNNES